MGSYSDGSENRFVSMVAKGGTGVPWNGTRIIEYAVLPSTHEREWCGMFDGRWARRVRSWNWTPMYGKMGTCEYDGWSWFRTIDPRPSAACPSAPCRLRGRREGRRTDNQIYMLFRPIIKYNTDLLLPVLLSNSDDPLASSYVHTFC